MKRSALPLVCGRYGRERFRRSGLARRDRLKAMTAIVTAVVGEHARDAHATPCKPGDRASEEGRRRGAGLIGQDFDVGGPTVVIDRDVRVLPADAFDARPAVAMNPVADAGNAAERFDIEMHQIARMRPFVARDGRRRCEPCEPIESGSRQDGGDGRARDLELHGDGPGAASLIAGRHDAGRHGRRRSSRLMMRRRRAILEGRRPARR